MRLPNGYGSVYKLSGKRRNPWVARKTVGWVDDFDNQTSHPNYKFIGYYSTKQEALQALAEYNADPFKFDCTAMTLKDLYERWALEHFEDISDSNITGVKAVWKICKPLEKMKITDLKLDHFQKLVDESGKHSPTLKKLKTTLGLMYDYAVMHEILPQSKRDMISYINTKKAGNPNAIDRKKYSNKELDLLWKHKEDERVMTVLIMIYSSCRIGELLNLKKVNVNLEEKWFDIIKSKTEAGIRRVPIADKIFPFFVYWYYKNDSPYLISNGKKISYGKYRYSYRDPVNEELGMTHLPHDTRHTCVSMLTAKKVDERFIKKIVGHENRDDVTQSVYTHLDVEELRVEINKI